MSVLGKLVQKLEIDLSSPTKNQRFSRALSELVSILFAVVFGVGLSQLGEIRGGLDLFVLIVAYVAIILSWWGYHYGTIKGPAETNFFSYLLDVLIVIWYWFLINWRAPLWRVALVYVVIFLLYGVWEAIRVLQRKWEQARTALLCNLGFTGCFCAVFLMAITWAQGGWFLAALILFLVLDYRIVITLIYRGIQREAEFGWRSEELGVIDDQELVALATEAKQHALARLSGYKVGAAVVGDSGATYRGANVEFENYSNTIHAEEAAIAAAVCGGETRLIAVCVLTDGPTPTWPCGMCLQSLYEMGGDNLRVIAANGDKRQRKTLRELLPHGFSLLERE